MAALVGGQLSGPIVSVFMRDNMVYGEDTWFDVRKSGRLVLRILDITFCFRPMVSLFQPVYVYS